LNILQLVSMNLPEFLSLCIHERLTSIYCRGQRKRGAIPSFPEYAFMAWCLFKHRDNFTFTIHERSFCVAVSMSMFSHRLN